MKVKHILVQHQYEAEDILRKLSEGKTFEDLARTYSTCSSAPQGGDLGLVKTGKFVEDFEEAACGLKPGEISKKPVRTAFGYHIIFRYL